MKLDQKQCEAFADILVLAMCVDGHFSLAEEEEMTKIIDSIGWNENLSPTLHVSTSISKARDLIGCPDKIRAYIEKLVPVVSEPQVARFIFEETGRVLNSDGGNADEGVFIKQLRAVLSV